MLTSEAALYRFHTPSPQVRSVNNLYSRTPNSSCNSSFLDNESYLEGPAAPQPEICLEHLWTEPVPPIRCVCLQYCTEENTTKSLKYFDSFLSVDVVKSKNK